MRAIVSIFSLFGLFLIINCNQTLAPINKDTYRYISYDSTGNSIVTGWFTLNLSDTNNITGEWHFKPINNPKDIGPQVGDGKLIGVMKNGQISLELNPQFMDNNLSLRGILSNDRFNGQWIWYSFIGITNKGTFDANKN